MTGYLRVKDWEKFQHYKDRNPPWIKLDTQTFSNYDFQRLQDASKLLAVCIWTLASRYKDPKLGLVPNDLEYIKRQCNLGDFVKVQHLKELINQGYIIDDSEVLADCKQDAIPETYSKETYSKEAEAENTLGDFENFWNVYGKIGNKQQAIKSYNKTLKLGMSHEKIINGVGKYQNYCRSIGQEQRFIKHASTWLNNRGWEDDYAIYEQPAQKTESKHMRARKALGLA